MISFEKKKTEKINQELRIRDSIFQIATAEMDSFVFLYDATKDKMDFMSENIKALGVPKSVKQVSKEMLEHVSAENAEEIRKSIETVQMELKEGKKTSEIELQIVKGFEIVYYQVKMTHLYDVQNHPVRSVGMVYDVTEKKQKELLLKREEKIRNLFMADTIAFYEIDIEKDIVVKECADRRKEVGKYSDILEQFVEKRVLERYQDQVRERCSLEYMKQCFKQRIYDYIIEYEYVRHDGSPYWVACEMHLEEDKGRKKAFMTVRDIDSKKRTSSGETGCF